MSWLSDPSREESKIDGSALFYYIRRLFYCVYGRRSLEHRSIMWRFVIICSIGRVCIE
jgi:hypothetical protein